MEAGGEGGQRDRGWRDFPVDSTNKAAYIYIVASFPILRLNKSCHLLLFLLDEENLLNECIGTH